MNDRKSLEGKSCRNCQVELWVSGEFCLHLSKVRQHVDDEKRTMLGSQNG